MARLRLKFGVRLPEGYDRDPLEIVRDVLAGAGEDAAEKLRAEAPVRTGRYRGSFEVERTATGARLKNVAPYSAYVRRRRGASYEAQRAEAAMQAAAEEGLREAADLIAASLAGAMGKLEVDDG